MLDGWLFDCFIDMIDGLAWVNVWLIEYGGWFIDWLGGLIDLTDLIYLTIPFVCFISLLYVDWFDLWFGWLVGWLGDWLFGWLFVWLICSLFVWLAGSLAGLDDWLIEWMIDCLVGWFAWVIDLIDLHDLIVLVDSVALSDCSVDLFDLTDLLIWFIEWLIDRLVCCLIGWMIDLSIEWFIWVSSLIDRLLWLSD